VRLAAISLALVLGLACASCGGAGGAVHPTITASAGRGALAISDALEALIDGGKDTPSDREYAYESARAREEGTAAYAFARAAITGRLVQERGMTAAHLVPDIERWARRSRELDPSFRDGAATRLLGTLYVLAPGALLRHGDSEEGLALLEGLTAARPDVLENHLRLAEALIALGDRDPAVPHLCRCQTGRASLRRDDARLLDQLLRDAGSPRCASP
jgi:hypothetical protein